jgi:hypothetical protein
MSWRIQAIGRIVAALFGLAAAISASHQSEQYLLVVVVGAMVVASAFISRQRYDVLGASLLGLALPTVPWVGSHILLASGLLFFAIRRPTDLKGGDTFSPAAPVWIAPLLGYLCGGALGEVLAVLGSPGISSGGVIDQVRIDGFKRGVDLVRSVLDVHVPSWPICARLTLAVLCVSFFSSRREATAAFVRGLGLGCGFSAAFVIVQWLGFLPFAPPNQTPLWDALGRPSGLMTDPNALGVVLALSLWVSWLVPEHVVSAPAARWGWRALLVVAGVVSGSRTFLVAVGILVPVMAWQAGRLRLVWGSVASAVVVVLVVTALDGSSGFLGHVVASESLPVGLRRGLAAMSLLRLNETFMSRGVFLAFAREIGQGHWLFGIGADRFIDYVPLVGAERNLVRGWRDNSNNTYLGILVELGVVGGFAFLAAVMGFCLKRDVNRAAGIGCLCMLGVIGCTGPHTDFVEVAILVSVLVALITESRWFARPVYISLAVATGFLGVIASMCRENGVYGWNNTSTGAVRWLSHVAMIEAECTNSFEQPAQARVLFEPRYVPQTEPLRVTVAADGQAEQELLLGTTDVREVAIPCKDGEQNLRMRVETHPAWSPYRAWPRISNDRRILGIQQVVRVAVTNDSDHR